MSLIGRIKRVFGGGGDSPPEAEEPRADKAAPLAEGGLSPLTPLASPLGDDEDDDDWLTREVRVWRRGDVILDTYLVEDVKIGGMGYVYIAEHLRWKVKMAIKCPNEEVLAKKRHFARVLREADAWIGLGLHPHIAFCYYVRRIEGVPNIFIEYVDGGNLREWIKRYDEKDLRSGLELALQFCHGMHYAHSKGMVHRDIKPENILLTSDGLIKITDFGIAMLDSGVGGDGGDGSVAFMDLATAGGEITSAGAIMGSPYYMPPEQWEDSHGVDFRADIYSFGVCMYEMFCGRRPYKGSVRDAWRVNESPLDPRQIRPEVPPSLVRLMERCVAFDPGDRFSSFLELKDELVSIYEELYGEAPRYAEVSHIGLKADGLNNRAISYWELGRTAEAKTLWRRALEEDPHHLEANFNYGYTEWRRLEITDEALLARMRELESTWGESPEYWRCMGWIHLERGDVEAAREIRRTRWRGEVPEFGGALARAEDNALRPRKVIRGASWGLEDFTALAVSDDGRRVLTGSANGTIALWDVFSGTLIRTLEGHDAAVTALVIDGDGDWVVSGGEDGVVAVWDLTERRLSRSLSPHGGAISAIRFSPDGVRVASASGDSTVLVWDFETGDVASSFAAHKGGTLDVDFSPDGRYLMTGGLDGLVKLWDLRTGREVRVYEGHNGAVHTVAFSPDGRLAASGGADYTVRLWDVVGGRQLREYRLHSDTVSRVAFSRGGRYVLSGGWDKLLRLWRVESGHGSWQEGHTGRVSGLCFADGGSRAVSCGSDGVLVLWDVQYPTEIPAHVHPFPMLCRVKTVSTIGTESDRARRLLAMAEEKMVEGRYGDAFVLLEKGLSLPGYERDRAFLDAVVRCAAEAGAPRTGLEGAWSLRTLSGHSDWVTAVRFTPGGGLLSAGCDGAVRLWEVPAGHERAVLHEERGSTVHVSCVDVSSDGALVASGGWDRVVKLWDLARGRVLKEFRGHEGYITSVSFSADDRYVLSSATDGTIRLWDVHTGKEVLSFEGHQGAVYSASFSPDNSQVVSAGEDGTIRIWSLKGGTVVRSFEGHPNGVMDARFSHDGQRIASGGQDDTLRLWDVRTGEEVGMFEGHRSWVSQVCWCPGDRFVLTAGRDATMRLWDVVERRELRRFEGHTAWVTSVDFSPCGRYAASCSWDGTVMLWEFKWTWDFGRGADRG